MKIKINKSYQYRIYPTPKQRLELSKAMGCARFVYNHFLGRHKKAYKEEGKSWNVYEASRELTKLKKTEDKIWLSECPSTVLQQSLRNLDSAFKRFFNKTSKHPKFKRKHDGKDSITFQLDQQRIDNIYKPDIGIVVPKIGMVKFKWTRTANGKPKMATIRKDSCNHYYISFSVEEELPEPNQKTNDEVGIDLGLKDTVTLSNGDKVEAPKFFRKLQVKLAKEQKRLSRKTKDSKRRYRQRLKVAKIHRKIKNLRKDFIHKLTTNIVRKFDMVAIEDLNVVGMSKGIVGGKSVLDAGLGEIRRQLTYKADWYGRELIVIGRFDPTTSVCSTCGCKLETKLSLSQRTWTCPECFSEHDRDVNAAKNILKLAKRQEGY